MEPRVRGSLRITHEADGFAPPSSQCRARDRFANPRARANISEGTTRVDVDARDARMTRRSLR
eukprot:31342-Pelagococcus_subviridis.AAC.30